MVEEVEYLIPTKYPTRYAKFNLWQSSPTFGLYVAKLFETNGRMGKRQETGAFKPVL